MYMYTCVDINFDREGERRDGGIRQKRQFGRCAKLKVFPVIGQGFV